jgi:hypothetical protein
MNEGSFMNSAQQTTSRKILTAFAVYLLVCGGSAIFIPSTWLWAAGLASTVTSELALVFGVLGAYLLALATGSWIASLNAPQNRGLIIVLLVSQILDFLSTLLAVYNGSLPRIPGTLFLVVTVVWSTLLSLVLRFPALNEA